MFITKNKDNLVDFINSSLNTPIEKWDSLLTENRETLNAAFSIYFKNLLTKKDYTNYKLIQMLLFLNYDKHNPHYFKFITECILNYARTNENYKNEINTNKLNIIISKLNINSYLFKFLLTNVQEVNVLSDKYSYKTDLYLVFRHLFRHEFKNNFSITNDVKHKWDAIFIRNNRYKYSSLGIDLRFNFSLSPYPIEDILDNITIKNFKADLYMKKVKNRIGYIFQKHFQNFYYDINGNLENCKFDNYHFHFELLKTIPIENFGQVYKEINELSKIIGSFENAQTRDIQNIKDDLKIVKEKIENLSSNEFIEWHGKDQKVRHSLNQLYKKSTKLNKREKLLKNYKYDIFNSIGYKIRTFIINYKKSPNYPYY